MFSFVWWLRMKLKNSILLNARNFQENCLPLLWFFYFKIWVCEIEHNLYNERKKFNWIILWCLCVYIYQLNFFFLFNKVSLRMRLRFISQGQVKVHEKKFQPINILISNFHLEHTKKLLIWNRNKKIWNEIEIYSLQQQKIWQYSLYWKTLWV